MVTATEIGLITKRLTDLCFHFTFKNGNSLKSCRMVGCQKLVERWDTEVFKNIVDYIVLVFILQGNNNSHMSN